MLFCRGVGLLRVLIKIFLPKNFVQCRLDKLIRDMKLQIKEHHTEMEEQNLKLKCASLKRRISEVEENNEIATLALSRTKAAIRRLRLEYVILLERLEDRATKIPDGINLFEEMASPPTPNVLDDALIAAGLSRNGIVKKPTKKVKSSASNTNGNSNSSKLKARDPDLPKRPTNAYLIFCEMEKERIKQENEEKHPGMTNDLSKSMTEAWKNLPEEERKPYYKLYEDDRMRYQKEKAVYKQKKLAPSDEPEEQKVTKKKPENTASSQRTPEISDTKGADIELKDVTQQVDNDIAEEDQNDTEDVQMEPSSSQGLTVDSTHKDDTSPKK